MGSPTAGKVVRLPRRNSRLLVIFLLFWSIAAQAEGRRWKGENPKYLDLTIELDYEPWPARNLAESDEMG